MIKFITISLTTLLLAVLGACSSDSGLSRTDLDAVIAAQQAYDDAWLANDPEAVMALLTSDAVMIPHHGNDPLIGADAIREWWFPPNSPPSTVTHMISSVTEILGAGDLGVVWGRFELAFEYAEVSYSNGGNYLTIYQRGDGGIWRIARRIWNDPTTQTE